MKRWLPSPWFSAALALMWLLLEQSLAPGTLLMAGLLAFAIPALTASLRPTPVRIRRPGVVAKLAMHVVGDMLHASLRLAGVLLTRRAARIPAAFVRVPLDVRDPNALAVLSMIVCLTPATAWAELSLDRSVLLLHVLLVDEEAAFVTAFKARYERPLMEIFE